MKRTSGGTRLSRFPERRERARRLPPYLLRENDAEIDRCAFYGRRVSLRAKCSIEIHSPLRKRIAVELCRERRGGREN